jgi:hypothetical protein
VLLGTICHVVAGLRTEICEFIINTAALLVKLAMVTSLGPEREMEGYGADQEFILKSLPTSLYTALSKFDIGSKTTLHAACPSCNYTQIIQYSDLYSDLTLWPEQLRLTKQPNKLVFCLLVLLTCLIPHRIITSCLYLIPQLFHKSLHHELLVFDTATISEIASPRVACI